MQTIDLAAEQVETVEIASVSPHLRRMSEVEARQKLDDVVAHLEQADCILQKQVKSHLDQAISIMLDIDEGQGWGNLGYRSVRHMIQTELEPRFSLSGSQFYRRFSAAKVRKEVSQIWSNVDAVPDAQLNELRKLPCVEWSDALSEITSKAPNGKVTAKHIREIVENRRQSHKRAVDLDLPDEQQLHDSNGRVENLNDDGSSENYQLPENIMEQTNEENFNNDSNFASSSSSAIEVTNIVTIRTNNPNPEQQQYSGCWGILVRFFEQSAFISVGGTVVEYLLTDINSVENPSPNLIQACDRIKNLWQIPNLPASVQHLLTTFYQRRLDFSQSDLNVLAAISTCVRPSLATDLTEEEECLETNSQNKIKAAGVHNQIASIISPTE